MTHRLTAAFLILGFVASIDVHAGNRKGPIVRQVDRILVESADPKGLFDFFSGELQWPEAWPLAENRGYVSGGIGAGNVTIELYRHTTVKSSPGPQSRIARFSGLALEPYPLANALRELRVEGIRHDAPQPTVSKLPDGSEGVVWTTVPLPEFSRLGFSVFLFEYSDAFLKADVRRKQLGNRLTLNRGGPLGAMSVREIILSARQFERERFMWQRLLGNPVSPGLWALGTGPSIRLVPGARDEIQKIVVRVRSLERARDLLKKRNWIGLEKPGEVSMDPRAIQGLSISLVE